MKTVFTAESLIDNTIHYFKSESSLNSFLQADKGYYIIGKQSICKVMYNELF